MTSRWKLILVLTLAAALSPAFAQDVDPDGDPPIKQGFLKGHVYIAFAGGDLGPPSGSLVSHEREVEKALRNQVAMGALRVRLGNLTVPQGALPGTIPTSFQSHGYSQIDTEYAISSHFGLGLSYSAMKITYSQQDALSSFSQANIGGELTLQRQDIVFALPLRNTLYNGRITQVSLTFHPLSDSRLDPFVAVRAGWTAFDTMAHADLNVDPYRYFRRPTGTGTAVGAGIGLNLYFSWDYALRLETGIQRQALKSDIFSNRTLVTHHAVVGLVVNLTRFTESEE